MKSKDTSSSLSPWSRRHRLRNNTEIKKKSEDIPLNASRP